MASEYDLQEPSDGQNEPETTEPEIEKTPQDEFEVFESADEFFENLSQTEDVKSENMYNDIDGELSAEAENNN